MTTATVDSPALLTYQHCWTHKDRFGDLQYVYLCTWSDGSSTEEGTLPWGQLGTAERLPNTSLKEIRKNLIEDLC